MISEQIDKKISVNINILKALTEMENYDEFSNEFVNLIKNSNKDLRGIFLDIIDGKFVLGYKKLKEFASKYKSIVNTMKHYNCTHDLILFKYSLNGEINDNSIDIIYEHIRENKEKIKEITLLINKMIYLEFDDIVFSKNNDFSQVEYKYYKSNINNSEKNDCDLYILENMKIIPTNKKNLIKYKSLGSNYRIMVNISKSFGESSLNDFGEKSIEVNNLLFDYKLLPNELTDETTIGKIFELEIEKNKQIYNEKKYNNDIVSNYQIEEKKLCLNRRKIKRRN